MDKGIDSWIGYRPKRTGAVRAERNTVLFCNNRRIDPEVYAGGFGDGGPVHTRPWRARRIVPGIPPDPYQVRDGKRPDIPAPVFANRPPPAPPPPAPPPPAPPPEEARPTRTHDGSELLRRRLKEAIHIAYISMGELQIAAWRGEEALRTGNETEQLRALDEILNT